MTKASLALMIDGECVSCMRDIPKDLFARLEKLKKGILFLSDASTGFHRTFAIRVVKGENGN